MSTLKTTNIAHPSSASNNVVLASDGSTTISNRVGKSSYAIIADQKAQNTNGGTFTSGAWRTRDLNTEIADPDGIVSISGNQFTLGAGSYLIRWSAPAYAVNRNQSKLQNITTSAGVAVGSSAYAFGTNAVSSISLGAARVVLTASTVFEIQHQCETTLSTGFGIAGNFATEQYTTVEIFKEA